MTKSIAYYGDKWYQVDALLVVSLAPLGAVVAAFLTMAARDHQLWLATTKLEDAKRAWPIECGTLTDYPKLFQKCGGHRVSRCKKSNRSKPAESRMRGNGEDSTVC